MSDAEQHEVVVEIGAADTDLSAAIAGSVEPAPVVGVKHEEDHHHGAEWEDAEEAAAAAAAAGGGEEEDVPPVEGHEHEQAVQHHHDPHAQAQAEADAAAAAAEAAGMTVVAAADPLEPHHPGAPPHDPVLAAATAAAGDAAALSVQADDAATAAAVAAASVPAAAEVTEAEAAAHAAAAAAHHAHAAHAAAQHDPHAHAAAAAAHHAAVVAAQQAAGAAEFPDVPLHPHHVADTNLASAVAAALNHSADEDDDSGGGSKGRKDFAYRCKELKQFRLKHGHLNVPHKYSLNPQLGTWVDTQRRQYRASKRGAKASTLTQENIQTLVDLGFNFEPRLSREETWQTRVTELGRYRDEAGHCNVREDDREWPGLGKWVSYIRRQYRLMRQGRRSKESKRLSDERINQLQDMGFVFELREEMAQKRFREGIDMLKAFQLQFGHVDVPQFYPKNPTLGLCMQELKKEYGKLREGSRIPRDSALTARMITELRHVGFFAGMEGGDEAAAALVAGLNDPPPPDAAPPQEHLAQAAQNAVALAGVDEAAAAAAHAEAQAAAQGHAVIHAVMQVEEVAATDVPTESV